MRISHVIPNLGVGGAEIMLADLVESQLALGHEPSVVSLWPREHNVVTNRLADAAVKVTWLDKGYGFQLSSIARLSKELRASSPDIVHTHRNALPYVMLAGVVPRRPAVHTIHNEPLREAGSAIGFIARQLAFRGRTIPVALSEDLANMAAATYKLAACDVVSNGVPIPPTLPEKTASRSRFVFVGRMHADKHPILALQTFGEIRARLGTGHLDLFGEGPLLETARATAIDLGLEHYTTFHGVTENLRSRYREYDLLLSTSVVEGVPISMLEAMAAGVPVVSSGVGGTSYLLGEGRGVVVRDSRPEAYARAVCDFLCDEQIYASVRQSAYAYCRAHHSSGRMAAGYNAVYSRICDGFL